MYGTFACKQVERRQFQVHDRVDRPTVLPVCIAILDQSCQPGICVPPQLFQAINLRFRLGNDLLIGSEGMDSHSVDGRILQSEQLLSLDRPRHRLAIQAEPIRLQLVPNTARSPGLLHTGKEPALKLFISEEAPPGTRVDYLPSSISAASPLARNASYNCAGPSSTSFNPLRTLSDSRACLLIVECAVSASIMA